MLEVSHWRGFFRSRVSTLFYGWKSAFSWCLLIAGMGKREQRGGMGKLCVAPASWKWPWGEQCYDPNPWVFWQQMHVTSGKGHHGDSWSTDTWGADSKSSSSKKSCLNRFIIIAIREKARVLTFNEVNGRWIKTEVLWFNHPLLPIFIFF